MLRNYTAKYTKIDSGYMGQFVEWPEVVTEGKDLEECRAMLRCFARNDSGLPGAGQRNSTRQLSH